MLPKVQDGTFVMTISTTPGVSKRGALCQGLLTRSLSSDPRWREKVASLQDATLPYSRFESLAKVWSSPVNWAWVYKLGYPKSIIVRTTLSGHPVIHTVWGKKGFVPVFGDVQLLDSECKLDFLGKVREAESPFQAIPFFGELKETIDMVRHPLKGILKHTRKYARSVSSLRRRSLSEQNSARFEEILNNAYLQWTYGVAPLIGDIENVKTMVEGLLKVPEVTRISVSKKGETNAKCIVDGLYTEFSGNLAFQRYGFARMLYKVRISGALKAEFTGPHMEHLLQEASFNLRDFVPSMYELLPYSFLVDYFSSTGRALGGAFTSTKNLIYASKSTKVTSQFECLGIPMPSTNSTGVLSFPMSLARAYFETVSFNRSKADLSVTLKDVHFVHPSAGQWFNTAALGLSQLRANSRTYIGI